MAYAGIAIFKWTAFLVWGLRQLRERKFIAIATAAVVLGIVFAQIVGIFSGIVSVINMVPLFVMQSVLIALLLIGYYKA